MNADLGDFLAKLGLTEYEARTLATLFTLKEADSPEVARAAQVPKTRVYDVLDGLVEKGLAVKIFSRPKKYRAMRPNEVFQKLLSDKQNELFEWGKRAEKIGTEMETTIGIDSSSEEKVLKVKSRTDFYKILAQEMDSAQSEIHGLTKLDVHHHLLHDSLHRAAERNVTVKFVGEHPESFIETARKMGKNMHVRNGNHGLHAYVIDGKKVIMMMSDLAQERPEYHFAIWPENKPLAQTLRTTFDQHWKD